MGVWVASALPPSLVGGMHADVRNVLADRANCRTAHSIHPHSTSLLSETMSSSTPHALLSFVLHLALPVLLIFPTFSTPLLKHFYFIKSANTDWTTYGAFGYCAYNNSCTKFTIGWDGGDVFTEWMVKGMVAWIPGQFLSPFNPPPLAVQTPFANVEPARSLSL